MTTNAKTDILPVVIQNWINSARNFRECLSLPNNVMIRRRRVDSKSWTNDVWYGAGEGFKREVVRAVGDKMIMTIALRKVQLGGK